MSLTLRDWERINSCLVRLYRELEHQRHARVMLEVLNELVPSDSIVMNYFTPPDQLSAITLPENLATEAQTALVGKYSYQSPYAYFLTTEDASWKMTTDFMPIEDFQKLELHRLALDPLGIKHQIGTMLASMNNTAHIVTLHRSHRGFTERERTILNALHPHLVGSHVNAIAFSRSLDSVVKLRAVVDTAPGAYGYFNADGSVAWMQPKAQSWLLEFFPNVVRGRDNVPQNIRNLLKKSEVSGGSPTQIEQRRKQELLTAIVSTSPLGGWILRLERKPAKAPDRFRPLERFSKRKNEVLKWMTEGKRNAEIAKILGLSTRTIEKHMQEILAELGVENRATAIIRIMELCVTSTDARTRACQL